MGRSGGVGFREEGFPVRKGERRELAGDNVGDGLGGEEWLSCLL